MLDFHQKADTQGEGGFLGVTFHPRWPTKRERFVSDAKTSTPLRSVGARYTSRDNGLTLDPTSEERLFTFEQPAVGPRGGLGGGATATGP